MIKIQDHIECDNSEAYIKSLTLSHWNSLNPTHKGLKTYFKNSLIELCRQYKDISKLVQYRKDYAGGDKDTAARHHSFFSFLLKNRENKLKELIRGTPLQLSAIKVEIMNILLESDVIFIKNGKKCQTDFGKLLSETIFNYKKFRGSDNCKQILINLGFEHATCPYCNDNPVRVVGINRFSSLDEKKLALLDLDHFYPKSQNPFFAVSFFNLIPSCHDCNSAIKGDKSFSIETHINPYEEAFDNIYTFKLSLTSQLGVPQNKIDIIRGTMKPDDITESDMKLIDRYSTDENISKAKELIDHFNKYKHCLGTAQEEMFINMMLNGFGVPKESNNILRKSLGKLKRDILKLVDIHNHLGIT